MYNYFIGDIHGCYKELKKLLNLINFDKKTDKIWITGDLINRGSDSLKVLKFLYKIRNSVKIVLGNHEVNFLSCYFSNMLDYKIYKKIISYKKFSNLINWLKKQPLIRINEKKKLIVVHAGIPPFLTIETLKKYSYVIRKFLKNKNFNFYFRNFKSLKIFNFNKIKNKLYKIIFLIYSFTNIRYCFFNGTLDVKNKTFDKKKDHFLTPWYKIMHKSIKKYNVIFGHWSTLNKINLSKKIYCLDTGCCWGGKITALKLETKEIFSVKSSFFFKSF
ncbi:MAG: symmetrical bis(5'-nucleosyl)-tetraphosphatase [Enterobacteriaceae bacterium]